ncbi:MAG: Ig-like domain-containing protein [Planctomycetes bacterium]|nr:Ig-like domain-containing protein [Planctomycetota bacterium]
MEPATFVLREGPTPPPRAGQTALKVLAAVVDPLPAPPTMTGPPRVVRRSPEGAVARTDRVSVSFSQEMVALGSQEAASRQVPLRLEPAVPASLRWLGTKTAELVADAPLPMATRFTVEVPAGTRAASGEGLPEAERWTFETPPPSLSSVWPKDDPAVRGDAGERQRALPLLVLRFDQRVDPVAIARLVALTSGLQRVGTRVATADEVAAATAKDPDLKRH